MARRRTARGALLAAGVRRDASARQRRAAMIGPLWHPRRRLPSEVARPPRFELATKVPIGWVLERLAAWLAHWERAELATPEIEIAIRGLPHAFADYRIARSEEHTSELQSRGHLVCRLLLEKKKKNH